MTKDRLWEVQTDMVESLSLRLVDGHRVSRLDRELSADEIYRRSTVIVVGGQRNARDHDSIAFMIASHDLGKDNFPPQTRNDEARSIAQTAGRILVPDQHDWLADLQL